MIEEKRREWKRREEKRKAEQGKKQKKEIREAEQRRRGEEKRQQTNHKIHNELNQRRNSVRRNATTTCDLSRRPIFLGPDAPSNVWTNANNYENETVAGRGLKQAAGGKQSSNQAVKQASGQAHSGRGTATKALNAS